MDKENLKDKLNKLIKESDTFTYKSFPIRRDKSSGSDWITGSTPEWDVWIQRIRNVAFITFQKESAPLRLVNTGLELAEKLKGFSEDRFIKAKENLIKGLELGIKAIEDDYYNEILGQSGTSASLFDTKDIFIVHGHNHEAKNELELFLKEIGLNPIVLHRKADEGQTIIEKFEKHSKVGYAVILLTPDDTVVSSGGNAEEKRARQNVIFEFGFFAGRLGRNRVCCLYQEDMALPSDLSGLIYKPFKTHIEEIKFALIRELKAAGYHISL